VRVSLVLVPYHLGHEGVGMGSGPDALARDGLVAALEADGHEVGLVRVARTGEATNEIAASFEVLRGIAERVRDAVAVGAFPLVLAGNCLTSVGVVSGLGREVGVVWLDAHADFNTAEATTSGFADGMGLSILTGTGWDAMRATVPGYRAVPEAHVVLVGIRDLDHAERERLDGGAVTVVEPGELDAIGGAVDGLRGAVSDLYLHVDLDVLDPSEGRANEYAVGGGLTGAEVGLVVGEVGRRVRIRAASLTAYDPAADGDRRVPAAAARIARGILAAARVADEVAAR
jgi:arginase